MRQPIQSGRRTPLTFNITPLIDVVFLLIIFFLVASHFVKSESSQAVELPIAKSGQTDAQDKPYRLTVTIDQNGDFHMAGQSLDEVTAFQRISQLATEASAANEEPQIRIRPDRFGVYGPFRKLYEHCAKVGIRRIQFAVSDGQ
ncbi:MAG: biopolymer transporter ExbD [Fuerstiella sp.]